MIHTHTRAGMAVAAMKCGLLPISQTSIRFENHIGYHDYEGPAIDLSEQDDENLAHGQDHEDRALLEQVDQVSRREKDVVRADRLENDRDDQ